MAANKLKPFHKDFVREYIACGYVGQRAYLKLRPHVKPKTAQVEASKLLSLPIIMEELERAKGKGYDQSLATRDNLIKESYEVAQEARKQGSYGATIKGLELVGRLNRLFDKDEPETEGYVKLIQMLQINVSIPSSSEDEGEIIDVKATNGLSQKP